MRKLILTMLFLAPLAFIGCSDQLESENSALKTLNRTLTNRRKTDDAEISTYTNKIIGLQEQIRDMQSNDQEEITTQKRTITMLSAENIRQKQEIENLGRALADEKALFEKYKEEVTQQLQKPAKVTVTLTYKDMASSNNVPDNDASVSLHLIKDTTVVYRAASGTDGVAVLDRVKPGKYLCVIHSGNAHQRLRIGGAELVRQRIWKTDRTMLMYYLDDAQVKLLDNDLSDSDASVHFLEALLAKTLVREIEIGPQDDVRIKYDFGPGAF